MSGFILKLSENSLNKEKKRCEPFEDVVVHVAECLGWCEGQKDRLKDRGVQRGGFCGRITPGLTAPPYI